MHVTDRKRFKPVLTGIAVLSAIFKLYPKKFKWRTEPYEFVSDRAAIDLLYGNPDLREDLIAQSLIDIEDSWQGGLRGFLKLRKKYLLY